MTAGVGYVVGCDEGWLVGAVYGVLEGCDDGWVDGCPVSSATWVQRYNENNTEQVKQEISSR